MSLHFDENKNAENKVAYIVNSEDKRLNNLCFDENNEDGANTVSLSENFQFQLAPKPVKESERSVLFIAGESGSGKSYFVAQYAKNYHKMFPKNEVFLISYLDRDPTLDDLPFCIWFSITIV